ncbi:MAG: methylated-DNA--[protein]-cysteine S-methyltransferase [Firmicutes bacterium]|jgi:methylated-DNA-[protein]-cysteine S-methyltransferase|nr:methylated-DNA--[protein]-cysteine S-methyltransferase [Bacillota bacterium]
MAETLDGTVFRTAEGWCAFSWGPRGLRRFVLPRKSQWDAAEEIAPAAVLSPGTVPAPWDALVKDVTRYFQGEGPIDFSRFPVDLDGTSGFTRRVYEAMKKIPWGCVATYGELAASAGNRKAARAVGQACSRNPVALVIPCHRVVAACGLGGFGGRLDLKRRMLDIEGAGYRPREDAPRVDK